MARLRPIVESAVPALVLEVRGYLTAQEITVDLRIADVLDAAARETDPKLRRALEFEAQALGDLKALREQVGDATRIDELLRASLSNPDGVQALELLTPLTRSLVEASREAMAAWQDGARAYNDLSISFSDTRGRLGAELARLDSELRADRGVRDGLDLELAALDQAALSKSTECSGLRTERDPGIAEHRTRAYGEIDAGNREFGQCGARHCRTECSDHDGGHGDW